MAAPEINYSVKELLAKIEGKLDGVIITIGQKADKHDLEHLEGRVKILETEKQTAERVRAGIADQKDEERSFWERWRVKAAWAGGLILVTAQTHTSFPHL